MRSHIKLNEKKLLIFYFILTFLFSWSFWIGSGVLFRKESIPQIDNFWLLSQIGVFGPSLIAIVFTYFRHSQQNRKHIFRLFGIYVILILFGIFIAGQNIREIQDLDLFIQLSIIVIAIGIIVYLGSSQRILFSIQKKIKFKSRFNSWTILSIFLFPVLFIVAWIIVNTQMDTVLRSEFEGAGKILIFHLLILFSFDLIYGGAIGEEIGWRGFALPVLLNHFSPLKASLVLGVFWSLWHLPIDLIYGFGTQGISGVIMRLFFVCPLSIIITWFYIHTEKPILSALILHASMNILPILKFSNYELSMAIMAVEMMIFSLFIIILDRKFLNSLNTATKNVE